MNVDDEYHSQRLSQWVNSVQHESPKKSSNNSNNTETGVSTGSQSSKKLGTIISDSKKPKKSTNVQTKSRTKVHFQKLDKISKLKMIFIGHIEESINERNIIRKHLAPVLTQYCQEVYNIEFQTINAETSLPSFLFGRRGNTLRGILERIKQDVKNPGDCQSISFICLVLGHRLFTTDLPVMIEEETFRKIIKLGQKSMETKILEQFYSFDESNYPPVFKLSENFISGKQQKNVVSALKLLLETIIEADKNNIFSSFELEKLWACNLKNIVESALSNFEIPVVIFLKQHDVEYIEKDEQILKRIGISNDPELKPFRKLSSFCDTLFNDPMTIDRNSIKNQNELKAWVVGQVEAQISEQKNHKTNSHNLEKPSSWRLYESPTIEWRNFATARQNYKSYLNSFKEKLASFAMYVLQQKVSANSRGILKVERNSALKNFKQHYSDFELNKHVFKEYEEVLEIDISWAQVKNQLSEVSDWFLEQVYTKNAAIPGLLIKSDRFVGHGMCFVENKLEEVGVSTVHRCGNFSKNLKDFVYDLIDELIFNLQKDDVSKQIVASEGDLLREGFEKINFSDLSNSSLSEIFWRVLDVYSKMDRKLVLMFTKVEKIDGWPEFQKHGRNHLPQGCYILVFSKSVDIFVPSWSIQVDVRTPSDFNHGVTSNVHTNDLLKQIRVSLHKKNRFLRGEA